MHLSGGGCMCINVLVGNQISYTNVYNLYTPSIIGFNPTISSSSLSKTPEVGDLPIRH